MNKIFLIGNLTRDPETRTTTTGNSMCRFGLAVNRRRKVDGQPDVDFFNITCFGKLGEIAAQYLRKGRKACVIGVLQLNTFIGQDGQKRPSLDVVADDVEFLPNAPRDGGDGSMGASGGSGGYYGSSAADRPSQGKTYGDAKPAFSGFDEADEDELPF